MIVLSRKLLYTRPYDAARCLTILPSFSFPFFFSSSPEVNPSVETPFITDYLISTLGLLPDMASKLSKAVSHIKSPSQPDAVLQFLKECGFSDAGIKSIVSCNVKVLTADVESTLKSNMEAIKEFGFSESEIVRLASKDQDILLYRGVMDKIRFWMNTLGSKSNVLKAFLCGRHILNSNIEKNIMPKVIFLRDCGISDDHIAYIFNSNPSIASLSLDLIKSTVKRAEELGLPHGSSAFCSGLISLCSISRSTLESKLGLMASFGWSKDEITSVIRKDPLLLKASKMSIKDRMEFLVKQAGCEPSYVMLHPRLLMFSLHKRLVPRYHILQILKSKGLLKRKFDLNALMTISNKIFIGKYVTPYIDMIPELNKFYLALCAGNLSL